MRVGHSCPTILIFSEILQTVVTHPIGVRATHPFAKSAKEFGIRPRTSMRNSPNMAAA